MISDGKGQIIWQRTHKHWDLSKGMLRLDILFGFVLAFHNIDGNNLILHIEFLQYGANPLGASCDFRAVYFDDHVDSNIGEFKKTRRYERLRKEFDDDADVGLLRSVDNEPLYTLIFSTNVHLLMNHNDNQNRP